MAEHPRPDDLAQLRAEFDAFRTRTERRERHRHLPRRFLPLVLVALLVVLVPLAGLAAGPTFTDLNMASVHNANIQAIADAGITNGCDPGVSYCPNGLVTREEMASFLARTAGLGGNSPVTNARTAQTAGSATTATTAGNATQLGGQPAAAYARSATLAAHTGGLLGGNSLPTEGESFTAVGTRAVLIVNASAYRTSPGEMEVTVWVRTQGTGTGISSGGFTNEAYSHKTLRTGMGVIPLVPGTTYTIGYQVGATGTRLDGADAIYYLLLELP